MSELWKLKSAKITSFWHFRFSVLLLDEALPIENG
jgi:hypothetical protein